MSEHLSTAFSFCERFKECTFGNQVSAMHLCVQQCAFESHESLKDSHLPSSGDNGQCSNSYHNGGTGGIREDLTPTKVF